MVTTLKVVRNTMASTVLKDDELIETLPSEEVFNLFQRLAYNKLGIHLPIQKRIMLGHRLFKRLISLELNCFSQYYRYITNPEHSHELQHALELITTNETFFFREDKHFHFLKESLLPQLNKNKEFKVWSAACSTGEEPYSIAMVLAEHCCSPWSLSASDVNNTVLTHAKKAIYIDERAKLLPQHYRKKYCAKGMNEFDGYMRVKPALRRRVNFFNFNLIDPMDTLGTFDLICIRNVMIYFDDATKQKIIDNISKRLSLGGWLFISHSETLHGLNHSFELVKPAVYQLRAQ